MKTDQCRWGALGLSLVLATIIGPTAAPAQDADFLELGDVAFVPRFVEANGKRQEIAVEVELLDDPGVTTLVLEELIPVDFEPVRAGVLSDDGSGVFSGRAVVSPVCGVVRLRLSDPDGDAVSPAFELPSRRAYQATAVHTLTTTINGEQALPIEIDQGLAGEAILTIDSAARLGQSDDVTIEVQAGDETVTLPPETDCVERRIEVEAFGTELWIATTDGSAGDEVAVRLDAVADEIDLRAIQLPSPRDGRPLRVEATVTALGLPVPNAEIRFGLGDQIETVATGPDGVAEAVYAAESVGDFAVVTAEVVNTIDPLRSELDVEPRESALVSLTPAEPQYTLVVGERATVDLTMQVNVDERFAVEISPYVIGDDPEVEPGLTVVPAEAILEGVGPRTRATNVELRATEPGRYEVYVYASLVDDDYETAAILEVEVIDPAVDDGLVIYSPVSDPAILRASEVGDGKEVTFKAVVDGTGEPLEVLILEQLIEQVNESGVKERIPEPLGSLLDDGKAPDRVAGDLVYTGSITITGSPATRNLYRASDPSYSRHSIAPYTFEIVDDDFFPLALEPPSADDVIVEEPGTGDRFAADQVLVLFRPDVSPARMLELILEEVGSASLLGFEPVLDVAQIDFPGSYAEDVRRFQALLQTFAEVERVEPNHEVLPAQAAGDYPDQGALDLVRAAEARLGAGERPGRANRRAVAVLDSEVDHPQLENSVIRRYEACHPPTDDEHGTAVAGVVAAIVGDTDPGKYLLPVTVLGKAGAENNNLFSAVYCGLGHVAQSPEDARIVNLSLGFNAQGLSRSNNERDKLSERIFDMIDQDRAILVVAAAGNATTDAARTVEFFPAAFDHAGLVAVGNSGADDQPHDGDDATRRGTWVDMSAPGVGITTLQRGGGRTRATGTSMSAAWVAGAASVLWSRNPDKTPVQIERMLERGVRPFAEPNVIGVGRLDSAEPVVDGSLEVGAPARGSPASWPATRGECDRTSSGGSDFYRRRGEHGEHFLRCDGANGVARTEKTIHVPEGVTRLTIEIQVAAFADPPRPESRRLDLLVRFDRAGGNDPDWARTPRINRGKCDDFGREDDGGTRCTGWKNATVVVDDPPAGESTLVVRARRPDGGPVSLMVDLLTIEVTQGP